MLWHVLKRFNHSISFCSFLENISVSNIVYGSSKNSLGKLIELPQTVRAMVKFVSQRKAGSNSNNTVGIVYVHLIKLSALVVAIKVQSIFSTFPLHCG